jgi:hypothetical protein
LNNWESRFSASVKEDDMKEGEYTLIRQSGSKGYYGTVRLAVGALDSVSMSIDFAETCGHDWRIGTQFGLMYGWELYRRSLPETKGLKVRVHEIAGKPADTTNLVMAYVAACALWEALEWSPPKPPVFDADGGSFTFSKY